jgi:hypothetical protein
MELLASEIERELASGAWSHCAIYEDKLQRIWPLDEEDRKAKIAQFATEHGFRLSFYRLGLCAIFEKESSNDKRKAKSRP